MAGSRKDLRGRALRKGESQRASDRRYVYVYTDPLGRRKYIYAKDLVTLREKENELIKNQLDGLDIYVQGRATLNYLFDRYISTKSDLKPTTKANYLYMYDRYVRNTIGKKKIADIRYSDVLQFYYVLINEKNLKVNTLDTIHCILHPTFEMAVRDDIIRKNPTKDVMRYIKRQSGKNAGVRHALTKEQQKAFLDYMTEHPIYCHWWPLFAVLLGTGCRIGEALGLRWEDLDFKKRIININHTIVYY